MEVRDDVPGSSRPFKVRIKHGLVATAVGAVLVVAVTSLTGNLDSLARGLVHFFRAAPVEQRTLKTINSVPAASGSTRLTLAGLDIHPDVLYRPYTAGQIFGAGEASVRSRMIEQFRQLLSLYEERQGTDDNFSIRVVDNRTDSVLEVYEMEAERRKFQDSDDKALWDWGRIDRLRREKTRALVRKYEQRGIPTDAITIKWGRADQVLQARKREASTIEYEIALARYLGLSLLATEVGTVETFNDDRLVSSVGARSRYQMMPYVLRRNGVYHYTLSTAAGNTIGVAEEYHPLLSMEPAFRTMKGYVNATGHELPGISAYHTGPANIFKVYRMFLTEDEGLFYQNASVMDAYMWAVTTGYDTVSKHSTFRTYSRGYVASAYGSLRATEDLPIDTSQTIEADRVQLRDSTHVFLSRLLTALGDDGRRLDWGPGTDGMTLYERFRHLNPHFGLPEPDDSLGVDPRADVRLVDSTDGIPVRFFLPIGATHLLTSAGLDVVDTSKTFRFDHHTFGTPDPSQVTLWDQRYQELVNEIEHFGFTEENKSRLMALEDRFEDLAEDTPSHYRLAQLDVIRTHAQIWRYGVFDQLAAAVTAAQGRTPAPIRPPVRLRPGPSRLLPLLTSPPAL